MTKKDYDNFEGFTKCWICGNSYIDGNVTKREHCRITGTYKGSPHRDCNIKLQLNHPIPIVFHILKNYDPYFIMQELCKFDYKINIIQNGLEQYMSFNINSKLFFIDDFQFSSFPLNSLVKSLRKNDFN